MSRLLRAVALIALLAAVSAGFAVRAVRTQAQVVPGCTGAKSLDLACYVDRYAALTRHSGPRAALDDLTRRSSASGFVAAACHQLTHVVGRTAGEVDGMAAFARGTDVCASGYYHGITEAVMMRIGPERILDRARSVCAEHITPGSYSYPHYNCVHGMGHGFMAVYDSDVFKSLAGCDALSDPWEQHHCYGGVFMEQLSAMHHASRPSKSLRPDQPLYPCTAVERRYKAECYMKQTAYALFVGNDDFAGVFTLCRDTADADFRDVCYQGLGGDAAIKASKFVIGDKAQADTLRNLCLQGPDQEARSNCVAGAVTTIVRDLAGEDAPARALCAALDDVEMTAVCNATLVDANRGVPPPEGVLRHH